MAESVVGRWAAEKLEHLRKYLHAYTTIMQNQSWCMDYFYIDAFAGPGKHEVQTGRQSNRWDVRQALLDVASFGIEHAEQREFLAGSPRVALELKHPFTSYVFVERSPERVAALEQLKADFEGSRKIVIRRADCSEYLRRRVANNPRLDWTKQRAIVFLDPFGMQVEWEVIQQLADTKGIEIFLNLPVGMAIQRLLRRQADKFTDKERERLDRYFGSGDWKKVLYRSQRTLFGDDDQNKIDQSGERLVKWYRERLRTVFSHVSRAALIRNTRRGHLYYLMLCSHNPVGVKIANDILSAGEVV